MTDPLPPTSDIPPHGDWHAPFILEFSPDGTLAAVARLWEDTAAVLDIKSGDLRLIIDTGVDILGLGVTQNTVVVIVEGKVVAWNLPAEDCALSTRVNANDSVWTMMFDYSKYCHEDISIAPHTSISPNFNHIAVTHDQLGGCKALSIYDMATGKCLTGTRTDAYTPWFTPDGSEVWCKFGDGWAIIEDTESGLTKLEPLGSTAHPPGFPWQSPRNYEVAGEWVLDSNGERLLWLPRRWRSDEKLTRWGRRVLGLLHAELPDAVILEFGK